jgi:hypothetical protein
VRRSAAKKDCASGAGASSAAAPDDPRPATGAADGQPEMVEALTKEPAGGTWTTMFSPQPEIVVVTVSPAVSVETSSTGSFVRTEMVSVF